MRVCALSTNKLFQKLS